jgi:hypothetical protein
LFICKQCSKKNSKFFLHLPFEFPFADRLLPGLCSDHLQALKNGSMITTVEVLKKVFVYCYYTVLGPWNIDPRYISSLPVQYFWQPVSKYGQKFRDQMLQGSEVQDQT